jgi:hypothetical protein
MAKLVLTNPSITIGGVDLSSSINSVTLDTKYDIVETTTFGSTAKTRVAGLADNSISLEFLQDFAASSVEATIYPLLGTATTITIKPVASTVTTTNPSYTVSAVVSEWQPLKGTVGALATASVSWPVSGAITKATS